MGLGGIKRTCPACRYVYGEAPRAHTEHEPDQPQSKPQAKRRAPKRVEPLNVIKAAKARRTQLTRDVAKLRKALKAAENELGQLTRLLDAADEKPAPVRRLQTATR